MTTMEDRSAAIRGVLLERVTVHDYAPTAVELAVVERALSVAVAAPNHRMTEPWRFIVVGQKARQKLVEISLDLKAKKVAGPLDQSTASSVRDKMLNPAWLIVVCQVRNAKPDVALEDYAAIACAIQNIMLCLHAEGIGSKWSTGEVIRDPRTYEHLSIDPAQQEIVAFVWVGMPAKPAVKVPRRRPLETLVRYLP